MLYGQSKNINRDKNLVNYLMCNLPKKIEKTYGFIY